MSTRVYIARDAAARSVGADRVAAALATAASAAGRAIDIVRTGSRGLLWLEPLVEVETAAGRVAYGPVDAREVAGLVAAGLLDGAPHALNVGPIEQHPYFAGQERVVFARCGLDDPTDLDACLARGGFRGLRRALDMAPGAVVDAVRDSGLRGRGGAGFPTGIKWRTVLDQQHPRKYIVCNADEGDSGTFSDRMLMEGDPYCLIEGMTIAAHAVGASQGYIYLRSEYPDAYRALSAAIARARAAGYLGADVLGSGLAFDIDIRLGAGAYICGEETSLLESLEGKRGQVRAKPPLPAIEGAFGCPTVVNNVITLASVPAIAEHGGDWYHDYGTGRSRGTLPLQLAGNIRRGGLVEKAFGVTLRELLYDYGGGTLSGRPIKAVQVGGPLGAWLPEAAFDTPIDYEAFVAAGGMLGHGGIVVVDDTTSMADMARYALEFCAVESCGKCTPCRIGSTRGVEVVDRIRAGQQREANLELLHDLCHTMRNGSLCALGGLTPDPVESALKHFPEDFVSPPATGATGTKG
ncbi:MAG: formate dehydrogenase beta subunit [Gammaproteobacteria bacterium]